MYSVHYLLQKVKTHSESQNKHTVTHSLSNLCIEIQTALQKAKQHRALARSEKQHERASHSATGALWVRKTLNVLFIVFINEAFAANSYCSKCWTDSPGKRLFLTPTCHFCFNCFSDWWASAPGSGASRLMCFKALSQLLHSVWAKIPDHVQPKRPNPDPMERGGLGPEISDWAAAPSRLWAAGAHEQSRYLTDV